MCASVSRRATAKADESASPSARRATVGRTDVSTRAALARSARSDVRPSPTSDKHRTKGQRPEGDPVRRVFARRSDYTKSVFCKVPEDARACERSKGAVNRARLYKTPDFVRLALVIAKARQVSAVRGLPLVASRTATASSPSRTATLLRCSSDRGHFEQPTTSPSPRIYAWRRSCGGCAQCSLCLAVPRA